MALSKESNGPRTFLGLLLGVRESGTRASEGLLVRVSGPEQPLDSGPAQSVHISQPSLSSRCSDPHSCQPQGHCSCCSLCPPPLPPIQLLSTLIQVSLLSPRLSGQPGLFVTGTALWVMNLTLGVGLATLQVPQQAGTLPGPQYSLGNQILSEWIIGLWGIHLDRTRL